jgi:hypothetical protein
MLYADPSPKPAKNAARKLPSVRKPGSYVRSVNVVARVVDPLARRCY